MKLKIQLACLLLVVAGGATAQDVAVIGEAVGPVEKNLRIQAQVIVDSTSKPFAGVIVRTMDGTAVYKTDTTDSMGYFVQTLPFDGNFKMVFIYPGFLRKSVEFDTREMPEEDKELGYDAGRFKVRMRKPIAGFPVGLYDEPIARFKYDAKYRIFVVDHSYRRERKQKFKNAKQKEDESIRF